MLYLSRGVANIETARTLVREAGGYAAIVAKIERAEAITALEEIIDASDVIMVARGDLGVEVGDAAVPGLQKRMIRMARMRNKLVITATQMMESMISSPIPTRAEVSDVANAVLDGTDAVMLSGETAVGQYPVDTIRAMNRICLEAEKEYTSQHLQAPIPAEFGRVDEAIAMASIYTAEHLNVKAIAALTKSGSSVTWLSRSNTNVPIYALTTERNTRRKLSLYRGVYPYHMEQPTKELSKILYDAEEVLLQQGAVNHGDLMMLTFGEPIGQAGGTNTLQIVRVGEHRREHAK